MARRFYQANLVDIDESDYSSLLDVIDKNDQFVPFVLAYAKRALIEAREGHEKPASTHEVGTRTHEVGTRKK
jgi:hypothetical protein